MNSSNLGFHSQIFCGAKRKIVLSLHINSLRFMRKNCKQKLFLETLVQINKTILVYLIHTYLLDQTNILLALPSLLMRHPLDYGYSPFRLRLHSLQIMVTVPLDYCYSPFRLWLQSLQIMVTVPLDYGYSLFRLLLQSLQITVTVPLDYGYSPFNQIVIDYHHSSF